MENKKIVLYLVSAYILSILIIITIIFFILVKTDAFYKLDIFNSDSEQIDSQTVNSLIEENDNFKFDGKLTHNDKEIIIKINLNNISQEEIENFINKFLK